MLLPKTCGVNAEVTAHCVAQKSHRFVIQGYEELGWNYCERVGGLRRGLLLTMVALFIVGTLALIALVLLSDFPASLKAGANKADAPPEDVRRQRDLLFTHDFCLLN